MAASEAALAGALEFISEQPDGEGRGVADQHGVSLGRQGAFVMAARRTLRAMARKLLPHQHADGGFIDDPAVPVVQIDFITHSILALMGYAYDSRFIPLNRGGGDRRAAGRL